jgi:hypothetical protein
MKINSTLLAAALGLASVSLASATQYIYITGSTSGRGTFVNELAAGVGFDNPPTVASYGASTFIGATYFEFSNTISGTPTIVKYTASGSEAGIADVSGAINEPFLADFGNGTPAVVAGVNSGNPNATQLITNTVNIALADDALIYSKNPGSSAVQTGPIIAIPYVFAKSTTTIADQAAFTGITDDNFKVLASGGDYLGLFTGNPADQNNYVYLAGRDNNAGARVNVFDETGWGSGKIPNQIELAGGQLVNFGTALSPNYYTAQGQSSGGALAKSLTNTTATVDYISDPSGGTVGLVAVAYLGLADDVTAEAAPYNATRLTYDGVSYSISNVENGLYALWAYEYIYSKAGSASYITTFEAAAATNIGNPTYNDGYEIPLGDLNVIRTGPLSPPIE